jgi:hypothetical protein
MKASPLNVAPSSETGADLSGDPDTTSVKVSLGTVVVVVVDVEEVEVVVVDEVVVVGPELATVKLAVVTTVPDERSISAVTLWVPSVNWVVSNGLAVLTDPPARS